MEINIDLSTKPSRQFMIKLLQSIFVYLLHERAQIPFSFEVFERFLANKNFDNISCYKTLKHVKIAKEAYEKICSFQQTIKNEFLWTRSIVILFGSCIQSAKECYQINLPQTNFNNNQIIPPYIQETSILRNVLLQIITSEQFKFTNQLPITNTFILFNRYEPTTDNLELFEIRSFKLNRTCKKFILNIRDTSDFEIFQENFRENLSLDNKSPEQERKEDSASEHWYQSKNFIKGFNDVLVNNKSIWN